MPGVGCICRSATHGMPWIAVLVAGVRCHAGKRNDLSVLQHNLSGGGPVLPPVRPGPRSGRERRRWGYLDSPCCAGGPCVSRPRNRPLRLPKDQVHSAHRGRDPDTRHDFCPEQRGLLLVCCAWRREGHVHQARGVNWWPLVQADPSSHHRDQDVVRRSNRLRMPPLCGSISRRSQSFSINVSPACRMSFACGRG